MYTYWLDACFRNSSSVCLKVSKRHLFTVFSTLTISPVRHGKQQLSSTKKHIWPTPFPPLIHPTFSQVVHLSRCVQNSQVTSWTHATKNLCGSTYGEFTAYPSPHGHIFTLKWHCQNWQRCISHLLSSSQLAIYTLVPKKAFSSLPQETAQAHKPTWNKEWELENYSQTNLFPCPLPLMSRCRLSYSPYSTSLTFRKFLNQVLVQILCCKLWGSDSPVAIKNSKIWNTCAVREQRVAERG